MNYGDIFLFFVLPALISLFLTYLGYSFLSQLGNLIAVISILGGFLLNLLAIIYGQIDNIKSDIKRLNKKDVESYDVKIKKKFINEIHSNISFAIVLSIFLLLSLLSITIDIPEICVKNFIKFTLIFINYFLMILFTLTLLMILNRIYILFNRSNI